MSKKNFIVVLLLYIIVALAVTWPIVLYINSRVLGAPNSDIHPHLWDFWRMKITLLENRHFSFRTDLINFPKGGVLFPVSLLNALIWIPLQVLWGIEAAINLVIIFNLVLGALGSFALAYYLIHDYRPAFITGLIYGFSPFILSFGIASGGLEIVSSGWLPLYFLFFIRTLREKGLKNPILASIFCNFVIISCLYYSILVVFFIITLSLYFLVIVKDRRNDLTLFASNQQAQAYESHKIDKHLIKRIAVLVLFTSALILPVILSVYNSINAPDSIVPYEMFKQRFTGHFLINFSPKVSAHSNLIAFLEDCLFRIGKDKLTVSHEITDFYQSAYCGYTVVGLAVLALFFVRKKFTYFWFITTLLSLTMSLGPYLAISRDYFLPQPTSPIYLIIYWLIPQFKACFVANRFVLLVMLCLSVLAASGSKIIIDRLHKPFCLFFVLGISGLILFEFLFISPIQFPIPQTTLKAPQFYQNLASNKGRFGILELPFFIQGTNLLPRERFSYQMVHRKPITDIVIGYLPEYIARNPFTKKLVLLERSDHRFELFESSDVNPQDSYQGFTQLVKDNFRYVIVDKKYYQPDVWLKVKSILEGFMGKAEAYPGGIEVFRIKPMREKNECVPR